MIAAPAIRDQPLAWTNTAAVSGAVRRDIRLDHDAQGIVRQDDAAVSNFPPSAASLSSQRAALTAGDGSSLLAAALAFFRAGPASRLAKPRTGRLRL